MIVGVFKFLVILSLYVIILILYIGYLMDKPRIKFDSTCKIYDGKNPAIEEYEQFIYNVIKPRIYKLGISLDEINQGVKPKYIVKSSITLYESWEFVEESYRDEVIELIIDLIRRYDNKKRRYIPLVTSGSSRGLLLGDERGGLIYALKDFLSKISEKFIGEQIQIYNKKLELIEQYENENRDVDYGLIFKTDEELKDKEDAEDYIQEPFFKMDEDY